MSIRFEAFNGFPADARDYLFNFNFTSFIAASASLLFFIFEIPESCRRSSGGEARKILDSLNTGITAFSRAQLL